MSQTTLFANAYFDKIFYINLKKDISRNEHIVAQFQKFGITNYERIEAIALNELPSVEYFRNFNKKDHKYITGQLGCRASHVSCIRIAKQRNYKKVLILEDDVSILQNPDLLLTLNQDVLNDWDMLYFGGDIEAYFRNQIVRTHAYAIRDTVFDDVINMANASGMEIDNFYAKILQHMSYNYNHSGKYNIRIINPFNQIVPNESFGTNIHSL